MAPIMLKKIAIFAPIKRSKSDNDLLIAKTYSEGRKTLRTPE